MRCPKYSQHRQDSQNKLVKSERLATIGEVVANVSHEIRNPLVNIGGFAKRLLRKSDPQSQDFQYLEIIADETRRLENILGDILNYSSEVRQNAIALSLNCDEADCIRCIDSNQITEVFLNIMRNCIQAMPKGGKMLVGFRRNNGFAAAAKKYRYRYQKKRHGVSLSAVLHNEIEWTELWVAADQPADYESAWRLYGNTQ